MRHFGNLLQHPGRVPLWAVFALAALGLTTSLYSFETASNLLEGDDWRFLTMFYKKWVDHTLEFRDLFSDQHPILLHPIVYLLNAKVLSLQMKFGAYLGMAAKCATGGLLLWRVLAADPRSNQSTPSLVLLLCILLMFFGMNQTVEYSWALLTYECNVFFLVALAFSILLDRVLNRGPSIGELALMFLAGLAAILLLGTLIKLFLVAVLVALAPMAILDGLKRWTLIWMSVVTALVIVVHTEFLRLLELQNLYDPTSIDTVAETARDLPKLAMNVGYGLAAGLLSPGPVDFPSQTLSVLALLLEALVGYSIFLFYREQMWRQTVIPIVLVAYYLLTLAGAILFRQLEVDSGWPLYIPRYFPYYHFGWVGVIWIFYLKSQSLTKPWTSRLLIAGGSAAASVMLLSIGHAWKRIDYIKLSNARSEVAVCEYARGNGELEDVPLYVRGHFFSRETVSLLRDDELSVFHRRAGASRCEQLLR